MSKVDMKAELPRGEVIVTPHGRGWLLVQIGRGRYVKRFNLSAAEARALAAEIQAALQ